MKPIVSLKGFKPQSTGLGLLKTMERLFRNPKRHLRGPMYRNLPSDGRKTFEGESATRSTAICACAYGAQLMFEAEGSIAIRESDELFEAANKTLGRNIISVSERGLRVFRPALRRAIKLGEQRAVGRA